MKEKNLPRFSLPQALVESASQSEAFFRAVVDSIEDGIKIVNQEREVLYANRSICEWAGRGLDSLTNQKCYHAFHESVEPCQFCPLDRAVRENAPQHDTYSLEDKEGKKHFFEIAVYPVSVHGGEEFYLVITQDITDRKLLEDQLIHSTRLAALGEIAAGIAHEIRNPLQGIRLGLGALQDSKVNEEQMEIVERISTDISRLNQVVSQLLDFTRKRDKRMVESRPEVLVEKALFYIRKICLEHGVTIERDCEEDLPAVLADPDLIIQVFLNIILNAVQAMPEGGTLRIEVSRIKSAAKAGSAGNEEIVFHFEDTGPGIAEEDLDRVFHPFFSTKPDGTGLGLSTSRRIVEEHGGRMEISSRSGHGCRVTVRLPLRSPQPTKQPDASANRERGEGKH